MYDRPDTSKRGHSPIRRCIVDTSPDSQREREAYSRLRQLLGCPGLLRGALVESLRSCGKPACRCQRNPKYRHRSLRLGLRLDGKQAMVYVPADWEPLVRQWVDRYREVQDAIESVSLCFLKRLRNRER